jgi:mono/diheme cytochrome c family protein
MVVVTAAAHGLNGVRAMPRDSFGAKATLASIGIMLGAISAGQSAWADARKGEMFAERWCSQCHGVHPNQLSPKSGVPSFTDLARHPSVDEQWLRVSLRTTPHRAMPKFKLRFQDLDNVVSYILSLQPGQ